MTALLAAAAVAVSGAAAASFAPARGAFRGALAALFGLAIWSAGYAAALLAFGADPRVRVAKDCALVAAGVLVLWQSRGPGKGMIPLSSRAPEAAPIDTPRWPGPALCAAGVLAAAFFLEHTIRHPDGGWDAWAIWNLRARFLARAGPDFRAAFSPELLFWAHVDYPLLVPGVVAQGFLLEGAQPLWIPAAVSFAFAALCVAVLGGAARASRGVGWGALGALALLATPCFIGFAANQQADVPLAAYLLAACALAAMAVESREPRAMVLAGLAGSFAAWTKNEGAVYLLCLALALAVVRWAPLRDRVHASLRFAAGALPVVALLAWFKLGIAHANDLLSDPSAQRLLDLARWGELLAAVLRRLVYFQDWALWLVVEIAVLALVVPRLPVRPAPRMLAVALALALAATLPVYVLQPHPLLWFFRASIDRVLVQFWPSALLATILALAPQPGPAESPSAGALAESGGASPSPQTSANVR